jgi:GT2 family glycosyltransferase
VARFSVIIVSWNGKAFLAPCLDSLRRQSFRDFETILVDNGSSDGSLDFAKQLYPEVRTVGLVENKGFCGGNNEGIRCAQSEWIVLLNNDTEAHPGWLAAISRAIESNPDVDMFASTMVHYASRERINSCGISVSAVGIARAASKDELLIEGGTASSTPFAPSGGAAAYSRKMLERVGLFDEDFFLDFEDFDLGFRARLLGYDCRLVGDAIVYHHDQGTRGARPDLWVFYSQRNIDYVYLKNMPLSLIFRYGVFRILWELGCLLYFAGQGRGGPFLKAKIDVIKNLPRMVRKRATIQARKTLPTKDLQRRMLGLGELVKEGWFATGFRKALRLN